MPDPSTRERLLDAAWAEVSESGIDTVTLAAVATRAGVSRQAVYLHFGNRATLFVEMAARIDRTSGFRARLTAARQHPPREAFRRALEAWFAYIPTILPVHLALEAAAITGGEGAQAYHDRMRDWHSGIRIDVQRLADDHALKPGWSVSRAADWTWASVHPTTFHHLTTERGWTPASVRKHVLGALERELVIPPT